MTDTRRHTNGHAANVQAIKTGLSKRRFETMVYSPLAHRDHGGPRIFRRTSLPLRQLPNSIGLFNEKNSSPTFFAISRPSVAKRPNLNYPRLCRAAAYETLCTRWKIVHRAALPAKKCPNQGAIGIDSVGARARSTPIGYAQAVINARRFRPALKLGSKNTFLIQRPSRRRYGSCVASLDFHGR